jgi:hypothetical protein
MKVKIEIVKCHGFYRVELNVTNFPQRGRGAEDRVVGESGGWLCRSWDHSAINQTAKKIFLPGAMADMDAMVCVTYTNKSEAEKAAKHINAAVRDWIVKYKKWGYTDDD